MSRAALSSDSSGLVCQHESLVLAVLACMGEAALLAPGEMGTHLSWELGTNPRELGMNPTVSTFPTFSF